MNKKITATTLSVAMAATMAPAIMQTAPVNAASSAVQTLAGGAVAMAYVSTALNKMDNSEQGQQESLARTKEKTGYLNDSAAQARVNRIMKTLEASPSVKRSYVCLVQTLIQSLMLLQLWVALCLLIKVLWIPSMMINWLM